MLYLSLCEQVKDYYVQNFDGLFEQYAEPNWFTNDCVLRAIKEIDDTDYIGDLVFKSKALGIIGPDDLSGGVKCLISSIYKQGLYPIDWLGDNCADALMYLSAEFDLNYTLNYSMFKFNPEHEIYIVDFDSIIRGKDIYKEILERGCMSVIRKGMHF